ncbi:type II toxin-antitoxin system VapC family toxin [Brucella anthropi]|uniref:Type II toxin-antitoxin system VapC family toxin n=1 Tax=Brucella lupini TaxID=255457 RepID=A0AB34DIG7_9HYPH|nr:MULTISPECIES: type II toxin-antitoxin system VapC family toxin [Brucella/Ochrobactrum group]QOD66458.1 type II toxin-antitoxin system VapC family toxin [Ochrobactrum sp. MT180101]RNL44604.1 type II toxin-antitoxin system VapC family toxin [Ochrobactrum sp. MH181795]KAB2703063.1 type II toxin-antitoxin system VapC family toxin [Brucella lupini]KAB2724385.1 type II toxin-antitoxin system VapC family toxin [Brucella anthropi]KAB2736544.1 type II toxin-antitoxin system VapC family toxin [Brucel
MILADTSIWIDHFRRGDNDLVKIIGNDLLLCHPAVIGELALGSLRDRTAVLTFLRAQRETIVATHDEVMTLIERHSVFSMGIGYTDAHLLASVLLDQRTSLWTRDKRLKLAALKAGAALYEPFHS